VMGIGLFNFVKYALIAAVTMQLYIPLKTALIKAKLLPQSEESAESVKKLSVDSLLASILVVVVCILGILYLNGLIFTGA